MTSVRETHSVTCPKCGSDDELVVEIRALIHLTPDGSAFVDDNHEWDDHSDCQCCICGRRGFVASFRCNDQSQAEVQP